LKRLAQGGGRLGDIAQIKRRHKIQQVAFHQLFGKGGIAVGKGIQQCMMRLRFA
jgi:hypothetical protein